MALALSSHGASGATCPPRGPLPEAPLHATDHNGIAWPDFCFEKRDLEEHFFIIGDWGGIFRGERVAPLTAPNRRPASSIVKGIDDVAQILVAEQMKKRANVSQPRYILNVGDNFYWGGVETACGKPSNQIAPSTEAQWDYVFEKVYDGPGLEGKPWLGVLGNHDYGGYKFVMGWDQSIAYTWAPSGRWLTPAQYWSTKVHYHDFTVDYVFHDSNVNDAFAPQDLPGHNICSARNNPQNPADATCGVTGPTSPQDCVVWFVKLWNEQISWMRKVLHGSTADWRIVVTHYPPDFRKDEWARMANESKIDLIVTGHRHQQEVYNRDPTIGDAAWVVSGGGGGITSEGLPSTDGNDDQYGFFDVTISKSAIKLEAISHGGILRSTTVVTPRIKPSTSTSTTTETATTRTTTTSTSASLRSGGRHHDVPEGSPSMDAARQASHIGTASWLAMACMAVAAIRTMPAE